MSMMSSTRAVRNPPMLLPSSTIIVSPPEALHGCDR
jgi:hypothetical protein